MNLVPAEPKGHVLGTTVRFVKDPSERQDADYDRATEGLDVFGPILCGLISELLHSGGVAVHSISSRVKTRESATRKLTGDPDKYLGYRDLTDLLGVRVITYFPEEVDQVAQILVPEFDVDKENSVDKRASLDPDRFGYLSLHYIAALASSRKRLVEYRRFSDMRFELQIRSILQHAWAEIEHDLGYKAEGALPREMRRRFSRLAGLLELADDEFSRLRADRDRYEEVVSERMAGAPETLAIDQSTIASLLQNHPLVARVDEVVAQQWPGTVNEEGPTTRYAAARARALSRLGVGDVQQLLRLLEERERHAVEFCRLWVKGPRQAPRKKPLPRGIGLFYLEYTLLAEMDDYEALSRWDRRGDDTEAMLQRVREVWEQVTATLGAPPPFEPRQRVPSGEGLGEHGLEERSLG